MIMDVGDFWDRRRGNTCGNVWDKLGISYDNILEGFPCREMVVPDAQQRWQYKRVHMNRTALRYKMRKTQQDFYFWARRLA